MPPAFEAVAREQLSPAQLQRTLESDGAARSGGARFRACPDRCAEEVWGQGFPAPVFDDTFAVVDQRIVGGKHSRLALLRPGEPRAVRYPAILFNRVDPLPASIRAVFRPDVNEWNGTASLQLVIEYWQPA